MRQLRTTLAVVIVTSLVALALAEPPAASGPASRPAASASAPAGNVVQGMLVAKGEDWISVKAEGQAQGTRLSTKDGDLIAAIAKLTVPSRVKVAWKPAGQDKQIVSVQTVGELSTEGVVEGAVTAKGDRWIEVKPSSGGDAAERYMTYGDAKDVVAAIAGVVVGDKVRITWKHIECKRVMKLEKVGGQ